LPLAGRGRLGQGPRSWPPASGIAVQSRPIGLRRPPAIIEKRRLSFAGWVAQIHSAASGAAGNALALPVSALVNAALIRQRVSFAAARADVPVAVSRKAAWAARAGSCLIGPDAEP